MHFNFRQRLIPLAGAIAALAGCGAPSKGTHEVESVFKGSQDLPSKVAGICREMAKPQSVQEMGELLLDAAGCATVGTSAQNLVQMTSFRFSEFSAQTVTEGGEKVQKVRLRAQVWLNQDIANLAVSMSKVLGLGGSGNATASPAPAPGQPGEALGGLMRLTVTERTPMTYLKGNTTFSGDIQFKTDGIVNMENELAVRGQVRDNAFVINLRSKGNPAPFERTLLRKIDGTVFIIPYASDVYLDATFAFDMYSLGLDSLTRAVLEFGLGSALGSLTKVLKSS